MKTNAAKPSEYLDIVQAHYSNAISTTEGIRRINKYIKEQLSMEFSQVLMVDGICSDDINCSQYPKHDSIGSFILGN
ncbi:hypothetical protein [Spirosoma areae]